MIDAPPCPFCERIAAGNVLIAGSVAAVIADAHPEHPGHVLVVPRACEADLFALASEALAEVWQLVAEAQRRVRELWPDDGVRVRVNVGAPAGQTVAHAHVHVLGRPLIPPIASGP